MRKHFLKIFLIFIFFLSPLVVKANFGDLRYEVTNVNISGSNITFKGWAFIHRTHNYITVEDKDGNAIKTGGDQKVIIQAYADGKLIETKKNVLSEDKMVNYNFYCEMFYKGYGVTCKHKYYESSDYNKCLNKNDGSGKTYEEGIKSQCYYEDIYFEITFDIFSDAWSNVSSSSNVNFKIAASNNDFESKLTDNGNTSYRQYQEFVFENEKYTNLVDLSIVNANVINSNDYIIVDRGSLSNSVEYIASTGILLSTNNYTSDARFKYFSSDSCAYATWPGNNVCSTNVYSLDTSFNNDNGRIPAATLCKGTSADNQWLGEKCKGSNYYAIKVVETSSTMDGCRILCPSSSSTSGKTAIARGSHVKPSNTFKIKIMNNKYCEVTKPLPQNLNCNSSGTLSSTCEELTVNTTKGRAVVKIEQTGTVSSVMTPDSIYAGGGFKFGIMYYNNIKWSYVNGYPGDELHAAVNKEMNKKIKDFDSFVSNINITNLKLGDTSISSGMVKQCTSSSTSKNYYGNDGLTVSCVFTFPDSSISYDGTVKYSSLASSSLNINNKYYTLLDKTGLFDVSATISGMDRITENSAKEDSASKTNQPWTGVWTDSIDGCQINIYPLLYNNFVYRPIDINNPFPNRNAGINWYDWYNVNANKERLENTYNNGVYYKATLDNSKISKIKNYNEGSNYLKWDTIDENGESSFITDYDYVTRVGGN